MDASTVTGRSAARPLATRRAAVTLVARVVGVAMLAVTAAIHLRLYSHYGYRHIPTEGNLFLLNVIGGFTLAVVVLATPRRWLGIAAFGGAGYELVTLAGFVYAIYRSLFGFRASTGEPLWKDAVTAEAIGIVVLSGITLAALNRWRTRPVTEG